MNPILSRVIPLLACVALCAMASWVSIYAFWFAVQVFHSVPVARVCEAIATAYLTPVHWVSKEMGGDQTTVFFLPTVYALANGLLWGVPLYCIARTVWKALLVGKRTALNGAPEPAAKVR